jgi:hypothetical protein
VRGKGRGEGGDLVKGVEGGELGVQRIEGSPWGGVRREVRVENGFDGEFEGSELIL